MLCTQRALSNDYDQLHHFIAAGVWDAAPLGTELLVQDRLVGGSNAVLVIDDTAIPKEGQAFGGGRKANMLRHWARPPMRDPGGRRRPRVAKRQLCLGLRFPAEFLIEYCMARTKPEMALAEIDCVMAAGVRFGCVLADSGYGLRAPFRQGLTARKLTWAVGIPRTCHRRCADDLAGCRPWPSRAAAHPRHSIDPSQRHAGPCEMANHQLARRHERKAQGLLPPLFACGLPMGRRKGSRRRANNICPGRRVWVWSANTGYQGRGNTISPICRQRLTCAPWRLPSRREGFASRRTNN